LQEEKGIALEAGGRKCFKRGNKRKKTGKKPLLPGQGEKKELDPDP